MAEVGAGEEGEELAGTAEEGGLPFEALLRCAVEDFFMAGTVLSEGRCHMLFEVDARLGEGEARGFAQEVSVEVEDGGTVGHNIVKP